VVLYFAAEATKGQEDAVRSRLERDKRVRSVRFVSKDEALALMTKKYPALTKSLASNPLPDSLRVAVSRSDADLLRASLEPVRPPVDSVDASAKPCGTGQ
jgi:cell division protein FtsX